MVHPLVLELEQCASSQFAKSVRRFFKEKYCPSDVFIGIRVPTVRGLVHKHAASLTRQNVLDLMRDPRHEMRMAGLLALVHYYDEKHKSPFSCRQDVVEFYLDHLGHVDNWDLVDLSAHKLAGRWLNETLLLDKTSISNWEAAMNESNELWLPQWRVEEMNFPPWYVRLLTALEFWEIRVSLVLLLALKASHPLLVFLVCRWHLHRLSKDGDGEGGGYLIKGEPFDDPDLIHKAIGWVLREVGKGKEHNLVKFLSKFAHAMPRTTVSYSTERLSASERKEIKAKCK